MKCRPMAKGASYAFTEKIGGVCANKKLPSPPRLEIRPPVEMAGHWGFLCQMSNYCADFSSLRLNIVDQMRLLHSFCNSTARKNHNFLHTCTNAYTVHLILLSFCTPMYTLLYLALALAAGRMQRV